MSIWHYLILWFLGIVEFAFNPVGAMDAYIATFPAPVWSAIVVWVGFLSEFVDIGALFTVISILIAWRSVWLVLRLWRLLLEFIPMLG